MAKAGGEHQVRNTRDPSIITFYGDDGRALGGGQRGYQLQGRMCLLSGRGGGKGGGGPLYLRSTL